MGKETLLPGNEAEMNFALPEDAKIVRVFTYPGQGETNSNMARDFGDSEIISALNIGVQKRLNLDYSPIEVCGDDELYNDPANAQLATAFVEVALTQEIYARGIHPHAALGHSLGEYGAMFAAGAIGAEDAVVLAYQRGLVSKEVILDPENKGGMAVFTRTAADKVRERIGQLRQKGLNIWVANYNEPEQTVVSGSSQVIEELHRNEANITLLDKIKGAFHTEMVAAAADKLKGHIEAVDIQDAKLPLLSPTGQRVLQRGSEVKDMLYDQFTNAVQYWQTVIAVSKMCLDKEIERIDFVQVGPDKSDADWGRASRPDRGVLLNLINRTQRAYPDRFPEVNRQKVSRLEDIDKVFGVKA